MIANVWSWNQCDIFFECMQMRIRKVLAKSCSPGVKRKLGVVDPWSTCIAAGCNRTASDRYFLNPHPGGSAESIVKSKQPISPPSPSRYSAITRIAAAPSRWRSTERRRLFRLHCPQPVPPRRPGTQSRARTSATPPPPTPRCSSALFSFLGWPTGVAPHPRLHCTLLLPTTPPHVDTIASVLIVSADAGVSSQMVCFAMSPSSLPKEPLKSATQQVEIHVRKIYCSN